MGDADTNNGKLQQEQQGQGGETVPLPAAVAPTVGVEGEETSPKKDCSKKLKLNTNNGGDDEGGDHNNETTKSNNNANANATNEDAVPMIVDGGGGGGGTETTVEQLKSGGDGAVVAAVEEPEQSYQIQVMYNKQPYQLKIRPSMTVLQLKEMLKAHTGVDPNLQKVLLKGIAKDEQILRDLGVGANTKKILVIGSSIQDVLKVKEVPDTSSSSSNSGQGEGASSVGNWCSMQAHKKVIDKGLPEDVMPGILDEHDPLPPFPLHGMYSSKGSKVRLTFKLENDELWIGTKERTEKVPIGTIRNVISQPITGYEHYHIVAIQLGPTEASRFFVYWVPAQYVEAIKDALTGA